MNVWINRRQLAGLLVPLLLLGCDRRDRIETDQLISVRAASTTDWKAQFVDPALLKLSLENVRLGGTGSAEDPYRYQLSIRNDSRSDWSGVIKVDLEAKAEQARFFLPGFMYGTNQGEAEIDPRVEKQHPRLRKGEIDLPYAPYWLTRSDQLTHPVAIMQDGDRTFGISVSPFFTTGKALWQPGSKDSFLLFNGFGCALEEPARISFTLGYAYLPTNFDSPWQPVAVGEAGREGLLLRAGEHLKVEYKVYDIRSASSRAINEIIRDTYLAYHQPPEPSGSARAMIQKVGDAITRDAYSPQENTYALIWSLPEGLRYDYEGLIAWTNGMVIAYPLLLAAHRLDKPQYRTQALAVTENIVNNSINPRTGLPYTTCIDGKWSNRGWWWTGHTAQAGWDPDHPSYIVGQALFYVLKAYAHEQAVNGVRHADWLQFVERCLDTIVSTRDRHFAFPQFWEEETGKGYFYDAFSGAWCTAAMALYDQITQKERYLDLVLSSEAHYYRSVLDYECTKTPLDVWDAADSEGILAFIRLSRILYEQTGSEKYLEHLKAGLDYELSFKFGYNVPIQGEPLHSIGFSTAGGSITSVCNAVIHCMSNTVLDELLFYFEKTGDGYYKERLLDTYLWGLQTYNQYDRQFSFGKKGWSTEYFAQAERYVLDTRHPDGSWSNVWQAYHPWATASILEGMCGELWGQEIVSPYQDE